MEPFGTITNYYPFLSEETRSIVDSILKDAEGFTDFVERLVNIFLAQEVATDLAVFTAIMVRIVRDQDISNKVRSHLQADVLLKPWSFFLFDGSWEEYKKDQPIAVKEALATSPASWIRLHLLLLGIRSNRKITRLTYIEEAEQFVEKHPELKCFSCEIHKRKGMECRSDSDLDGAIEEFEQARKIAEDINDPFRVADSMSDIASCVKESDVFRALSLMEKSYQINRSLGHKTWESVDAGNMGLFHTIIGEYDLALEFYITERLATEPVRTDKKVIAVVLSRIYCDIDEPMQALEWMKWGLDDETNNIPLVEFLATYDWPLVVLEATRIMIQLGKLEGVPEILDNIHKSILKRGDDQEQYNYQFVTGLFELATNNLEAGFQSLAEALKEAERLSYQASVNNILLELTKAEVRNFNKLKHGSTAESSGAWMTRFGIHAREKNYPGIKMQHALLKAEYQEKIGESEAALLTLQDALTFTDSLGVKTLRQRILKRLDELETSVEA